MSNLDVLRSHSDFAKNIWGDSLITFSLDKQAYEMYARDIQKLKDEVRTMLLAPKSKIDDKMTLINAVQRLGISYHFEEEIELQIEHIFKLNISFQDYDLYTTSLLFRIFRQNGYKISSGIFEKFVDKNGKFKESLTADIKGMMSLFEAAQLRTHEDSILEEAHAFTKTNLKENIQRCSNSLLVKQVNRALNQCLHRGVSRLEAHYYMIGYEEEEFKNEQLLMLAKIDYNFLQMLHKQELSELSRWWKEMNLNSKLPYIRDRLVECYFWTLLVFFEPQYSFNRIILTKIIVVISVLDDMYDAYGTLDELSILTDSFLRWEGGEIQGVTDYINTCFIEILKIYYEIEESIKKKGSPLGFHHFKNAIKQYVRSLNMEAKWLLKGGKLPPFTEYLKNASITISFHVLSVTSFLGMKFVTKEVFDWVETFPKIVLSSMEICRLLNDLASHKIEKRRGNATGIDCYMKSYNVSEQEAMNKFEGMIEEKWKEINEELLYPITVPREILTIILNLNRSANMVYKHQEDGYTEPQKVIASYITAMILDPVSI